MTDSPLLDLLNHLILEWENEVVEFKKFKAETKANREIANYFSGLANEANLHNKDAGWLIFGVDNDKQIVGTSVLSTVDERNQFMQTMAGFVEPRVPFRAIFELNTPQGRVVLCEIPPSPKGIPIASDGTYYGRVGESLKPLSVDKLDELRRQSGFDWSAQVVPEAKLDHLDPMALQYAREAYAKKHVNRFDLSIVMGWSVGDFLDRAKLTIDGKITRTALLLVGKPESSHLLLPHPAQLVWSLEGSERSYDHFGPPFLLNTTVLYQRIRNIQIKIHPVNQLLPVELAKYDQKIVLEALHNCIAHQDYLRNGRILVREQPDRLVFENVGSFFSGTPSDYIHGDMHPKHYRNPFLVQTMVELNMIDRMGYGIHDMYQGQRSRYLPLPDYVGSSDQEVRVTLYGKVLDEGYTQLLLGNLDLSMDDVLGLDRIQKKLSVEDSIITALRKKKLIEGRKPNLYVSSSIASVMDKKAEYIHFRGQNDEFYIKLIREYLTKFESATRPEIETLLRDKLSDGLNAQQKTDKITNLISKMKYSGQIKNVGSRKKSNWQINYR